jgi:hypothetical protein
MGTSKDGSTEETRWLSYAELAEAWVISKRAAIRLTNRRQWQRQKGDDGRIRVAVPESELHREPDGAVATVSVNQDGVDADRARAVRAETRVQELTAELDVTRTQITDLRLRESMARTRAEALHAEVERLNALLEAGLLERLRGFWRRISVGASGSQPIGNSRCSAEPIIFRKVGLRRSSIPPAE